jgi:hypothetical protein
MFPALGIAAMNTAQPISCSVARNFGPLRRTTAAPGICEQM